MSNLQESLDYLHELDVRKAWGEQQKKAEHRSRQLFQEWMNEGKPKQKGQITQIMIERAKSFPMENLVAVNRGFAFCVWHEDGKTPNMSIRNNRAHCFSCGKKGDAIDVYQAIHSTTWKETIQALN